MSLLKKKKEILFLKDKVRCLCLKEDAKGSIYWDEAEIQSDVLLINFGASLLKLLKCREKLCLALAEWVWVIKPKTSQPLSLTEAADMPRVVESSAQETE